MYKSEEEIVVDLICDALNHYDQNNKIFLHEPDFSDSNALNYTEKCIKTGWVSSSGDFVTKFESKLESFTNAKKAVALSNGTVALRLALHLVGVKANDEVIVPPLSFVATCNAVAHLGAFPHFVDIENDTLGMDPYSLEKLLKGVGIYKNGSLINRKTGRRISAVCPVHVFGNPSRCLELKKICDDWSLPMVEDAAEALGSFVDGTHCGLIGKIGVLSFNGNKIITSGGGGAIITNNLEIATKAKHLSTTAKVNHPWEYFHDEIGWNDRLPNINAALGLSQLEKIDEKLKLKKILFEKYREGLRSSDFVKLVHCEDLILKSNNWLISLFIKKQNLENVIDIKEKILKTSYQKGIFLRPAWNLLSDLPMYSSNPRGPLDNAKNLVNRLINLPSSPQLVQKLED